MFCLFVTGRRQRHRDSDLRKRDGRDNFRSRAKSGCRSHNMDKFHVRSNSNSKYGDQKSRFCLEFEKNGFCPYGDKCYFNHGPNNLIMPQSNAVSAAITQLASSIINVNSLMKNNLTSSVNEFSLKSTLQPQSVVAAVIPNSSLNCVIPNLNTPIVPIYRPTPSM